MTTHVINDIDRVCDLLVKTLKFSVSLNGSDWIEIVSDGALHDVVNNRKARRTDFAKQTALYVRFTSKSITNGRRFACLAELELFGTSVGGAAVVRKYAKIQIRPKVDKSFCLGIDRDSSFSNNGDTTEMRSCLNTDSCQLW